MKLASIPKMAIPRLLILSSLYFPKRTAIDSTSVKNKQTAVLANLN
jgi:hypothetical protein